MHAHYIYNKYNIRYIRIHLHYNTLHYFTLDTSTNIIMHIHYPLTCVAPCSCLFTYTCGCTFTCAYTHCTNIYIYIYTHARFDIYIYMQSTFMQNILFRYVGEHHLHHWIGGTEISKSVSEASHGWFHSPAVPFPRLHCWSLAIITIWRPHWDKAHFLSHIKLPVVGQIVTTLQALPQREHMRQAYCSILL